MGRFPFAYLPSTRQYRAMLRGTAVVVTLTLSLVLLTACSSNAGSNPKTTAQVTPPLGKRLLLVDLSTPAGMAGAAPTKDIAYGKAKVINGVLDYQVWGQDSVAVKTNEQLPAGTDVRIWSSDVPVKMELEGGPVILLEPYTTIYLSNTGSAGEVSLERGAVLIRAGNLGITTTDQKFQVGASDAMVGVRYEPLQEMIAVNCFGPAGSCSLSGLGETTELAPGQHVSYKNNLRGDIRQAARAGWQVFYDDILPPPTATPTPRYSPTPAITATPTPVRVIPTATPTNVNPEDRDPRDGGGGGGGDDGGSGG